MFYLHRNWKIVKKKVIKLKTHLIIDQINVEFGYVGFLSIKYCEISLQNSDASTEVSNYSPGTNKVERRALAHRNRRSSRRPLRPGSRPRTRRPRWAHCSSNRRVCTRCKTHHRRPAASKQVMAEKWRLAPKGLIVSEWRISTVSKMALLLNVSKTILLTYGYVFAGAGS